MLHVTHTAQSVTTYTVTYGTTTKTTGLRSNGVYTGDYLSGTCRACLGPQAIAYVVNSPTPVYTTTTAVATPIAATYTYVFTVSPSQSSSTGKVRKRRDLSNQPTTHNQSTQLSAQPSAPWWLVMITGLSGLLLGSGLAALPFLL